ncbi:hypothetical protein ES705_04720 [subsurface metagenome]
MLKGKLIKLTQIEEMDLPKFCDWRNSPSVRHLVYWITNITNRKQGNRKWVLTIRKYVKNLRDGLKG